MGDIMCNNENNPKENNDVEQDIQVQDNVDKEALDVVFRLYDKTFKELVER